MTVGRVPDTASVAAMTTVSVVPMTAVECDYTGVINKESPVHASSPFTHTSSHTLTLP